jgi:hypothetical protein
MGNGTARYDDPLHGYHIVSKRERGIVGEIVKGESF